MSRDRIPERKKIEIIYTTQEQHFYDPLDTPTNMLFNLLGIS